MPATRAKKTESKAENTRQSTTQSATKTGSPFDRNGDNRIDFDDVLIGVKQFFQWFLSWRGVMLAALAMGLFSAGINVTSWVKALGSLGGLAGGAGVIIWGFIQMRELMPILDDLYLEASIATLVRLTRMPHEIPSLPDSLHPDAQKRIDKFQKRFSKKDLVSHAVRWICYGLEFLVLIVGGGILAPMGVDWAGVLLAFFGMVGVETSIRMFNDAGERLLSPEEREMVKRIRDSAKPQTVTL